jgi:DNA polymerase-3 subunit chi
MRVDFYQLTRDPAEAVVPLIARNTVAAGERLLVVSDDEMQLARIGELLWSRTPESFLAHGQAGEAHAARQPILLADQLTPENAAGFVVLADGNWREPDGFKRAFLLFSGATIEAARRVWSDLGRRGEVERHFWKQEGGKWREMA